MACFIDDFQPLSNVRQMKPLEIKTKKEALLCQGALLPATEWLSMTQERIFQFATSTNDMQWIHTDIERAKKSPAGTIIAHGFLTLSLATYFLSQMIKTDNLMAAINYGCDRVRFPNIVKLGDKIRAQGNITKAETKKRGVKLSIDLTIEVEGEAKPACVASIIALFYFSK